jgi:transposase
VDEDGILMKGRDRKRLHVVKQVVEGRLNQQEACEVLGMTDRQMRRIVKRYREEGDKGIIHRLRNRNSNAALSKGLKEEVLRLCRTKFSGFGPTLASEQLRKKQKIEITDETLRLWMREAKIPYGRRRERPHRRFRQRKSHTGEMLQMDGSHHDWLEGRGPWLVLMGYIDDATNTAYARFYDHEGSLPAMDGFKRYVHKYGIPCSVYLDRHTTYKSNKKLTVEEELEGIEPGRSQFQRAMEVLGVEVIHANSPQAKGRIERFFRTLQDRLVKEMRLQQISNCEDANLYLESYLEEHNKAFAFAAAKGANLHRPIAKRINLDSALSVKEIRRLRNDFTVQFERKVYQIEETLQARDVIVEQRTDGSIAITYKGRNVTFKELDIQPKAKPILEAVGYPRMRKSPSPAAAHPWHNFHFGRPWKRQSKVRSLKERA